MHVAKLTAFVPFHFVYLSFSSIKIFAITADAQMSARNITALLWISVFTVSDRWRSTAQAGEFRRMAPLLHGDVRRHVAADQRKQQAGCRCYSCCGARRQSRHTGIGEHGLRADWLRTVLGDHSCEKVPSRGDIDLKRPLLILVAAVRLLSIERFEFCAASFVSFHHGPFDVLIYAVL